MPQFVIERDLEPGTIPSDAQIEADSLRSLLGGAKHARGVPVSESIDHHRRRHPQAIPRLW